MTTITDIAKLYDYTLQQMAAESYFEGLDPQTAANEQLKNRLRLGTNRPGYQNGNPDLNEGYPGYTRMTNVQADEFLSKFQIIHQWSDNPTTGAIPGSRPLPEGDPNKPQLNDEILANTGLSATLIYDLKANSFTLAIRSTEFRSWANGGDGERDKTGADVTSIAFNGFALAQLDALEQYYQWLKDYGKLPAGATLNVTGYSLRGHLATVFTEMHQSDADIQFGETVTFNGAGRGYWNTAIGSEKDMIDYYHQVLNDPLAAPYSSRDIEGLRQTAVLKTGQPFDPKTLYDDPRYQWAMFATAQKFGLVFQPLSDAGRIGTLADGKISQVYGFETINNTNFTANSGVHGPTVEVGIESQPLIEGPVTAYNDFGNGHSITLIADSLALQRALAQVDKNFTLEKFIPLLASASNRKPVNGASADYEVDALENLLDPLRKIFFGGNIASTPYKEGASGFGDITSREVFCNNLKALTDNSAFKALAGKLTLDLLTTKSSDTLAALAGSKADANAIAYLPAQAQTERANPPLSAIHRDGRAQRPGSGAHRA